MKSKFLVIFSSAIVLFLSISCVQQSIDISDEISNANKAFMEAFNSGDMDVVVQHYTENGKLFPSNSDIITGRENIKAFWGTAPEMGVKKVNLETTTAEGFGNIAIEEGKYTLYTENDIIIDEGKYIVTWKKIEGTWLIERDIWTTSYPPSSDPHLQSGSIITLHTLQITLKENVTSFDFENFYIEEYIPELEKHFPGTQLYLLEGERGKNMGKYGELLYFSSLDERNYWFPEPGTFSEEGKKAWSEFQPTQNKLNEMIEWKTEYTDWLVH
jgi:ketosteroid isomerase-like protein